MQFLSELSFSSWPQLELLLSLASAVAEAVAEEPTPPKELERLLETAAEVMKIGLSAPKIADF